MSFLFRYIPDSLKIYSHHLAIFLDFVAASPRNLRHVTMTSGEVQAIAAKVRLIAKSLKVDIAKAAVERFVLDLPYL